MANNYIVRFENESSRQKFYQTLKGQPEIAGKRIEFGEYLPDLVIFDISESELRQFQHIAGNRTQFIPDFQHELFSPRSIG